jgi:hypothetical protein
MLANCPNQQWHGHSGNSQLPPAERRLSEPAGERGSSQGGSSVPSTIQRQISSHSSSRKSSRVADITQRLNSTPSLTLRRSINTPTAIPSTSRCNTQGPSGTFKTVSTHRVISRPVLGIACTPSLPTGLENLPTVIPNPEARAIITNALRMRATEKNQRQREWQLQQQVVSTPRSMVSGSRRIHRFRHSDLTLLVLAKGRLLQLYM